MTSEDTLAAAGDTRAVPWEPLWRDRADSFGSRTSRSRSSSGSSRATERDPDRRAGRPRPLRRGTASRTLSERRDSARPRLSAAEALDRAEAFFAPLQPQLRLLGAGERRRSQCPVPVEGDGSSWTRTGSPSSTSKGPAASAEAPPRGRRAPPHRRSRRAPATMSTSSPRAGGWRESIPLSRRRSSFIPTAWATRTSSPSLRMSTANPRPDAWLLGHGIAVGGNGDLAAWWVGNERRGSIKFTTPHIKISNQGAVRYFGGLAPFGPQWSLFDF